MDVTKFMSLYSSSTEVAHSLDEAKRAVRQSLELDRLAFYDTSGIGMHYACSGIHHGVGFCTFEVMLDRNGLVTIRTAGIPIPEGNHRDVERLCAIWNRRFILEGLAIVDGRLAFVSKPFDPLTFSLDCADATRMAIATIHQYASALVALEAGVSPWELIGMDDDDDDGGEPLTGSHLDQDDLESMCGEALAALSELPLAQTS